MTDPITIGYIIKTHGYKGDLKVHIDEQYMDALKNLKALFLSINNEYLPYFPVATEVITDNEAIIHLEDLDNKEDAQRLRGKKIYAPREEVSAKESAEAGPPELIGFNVQDTRLGDIGIVEAVYALPQQDLLAVRYRDREVLIPLREELIRSFLPKKKTIVFDLPDGILEI